MDESTTLLDTINLAKIAVGPDTKLYCAASAWYGLGDAAGIYRINTATDNVEVKFETGLEPADFDFNN